MVMADDENSDLAANAAEQKVTRNRRKFALRISRSRIEKDCGLSAAFILRDSSENSRELLFARSGEFTSCFSTLSG
jgi:hypothetical protein